MPKPNYNGHDRFGCPRCGGTAPMSKTHYFGNKAVKRFCCTDCEPELLGRKKEAVERMRLWREKKKEENLDAYRRRRADEAMRRHAKDPEKAREKKKKHYEKNKERLLKYRSEYIKKNPGFNRAAAARHRALILRRTPKWADLEAIKEFYKKCPPGMVVDHIVPLRGKNVSGLHVLGNLQYLTAVENGKKSNKFEVQDVAA